MMLSPADYAAYSRATGRPYPQSEEDKAQMYGDVREFRGNQTKNTQGNSLLNAVAVGAGVLGAGALGVAALRGRGRGESLKSGQSSGQSGTQTTDLSKMDAVRRVANTDIGQSAASNSYTNTIKDDLQQRGGNFNSNSFSENIKTSNAVQGAKAAGTELNIKETVIKNQAAGTYGGKAVAEGLEASEAKAKTMNKIEYFGITETNPP